MFYEKLILESNVYCCHKRFVRRFVFLAESLQEMEKVVSNVAEQSPEQK
jgi:hypothetical protein